MTLRLTSGVEQEIFTLPAHETCRHKAYALTCKQYEALIARCGNRCEICRQPGGDTPRTKLHIDHDCRLGMWAVRGLLCAYCNSHPYVPEVAGRLPAYVARSWYLNALAAAGVGPEVPPEPPLRSRVFNQDEWIWKRYAAGWIRDTSHHRARLPKTWTRLVYLYGPHNLHVIGATTW